MPAFDPTEAYCRAHSSPADPGLSALERETHLRTLYPQMLSGPYQGLLLEFVSRMLRPRRVLEVGTFTGYGTIRLARGLADGGLVHTIEANDELAAIVRTHLDRAGLTDRVRLHIGDAAALIPTLDETFDLVFLDGGKLHYALHYELVLPKVRPGGFLLADNVLWDGKVLDPAATEPAARALRAFNDRVHADPRVENLLLPVGDGLMMVRKL